MTHSALLPLGLLSLLLLSRAALAQEVEAAPAPATPAGVAGKVTAVTLYRGQAMVTREIPLPGGKGQHELVVTGLPENVLDSSLFAEGGEHLEVRAVRFRLRSVGEEPREEVRKLDLEIQAVNDDMAAERKGLELLQQQSAYLDKLEGFVAPTANVELSKGVLDPEALQKMALFAFERREAIASQSLEADIKIRGLQEKLGHLQRQRSLIAAGSSRAVREAVIFLQKHNDAAQSVRLSYLVANCGWSPSYTLRAAGVGEKAGLEYNALIQQMTGEDWTDVSLTLSTASPALAASGPGLAPFHVTLSNDAPAPQLQPNAPPGELARQVEGLKQQQYAAVVSNRNSADLRGNLDSSWAINDVANNLQCLELHADIFAINNMQLLSGESLEGPSLNYRLAGGVSLSSRSDQQMVRILQAELPSSMYYVATPVLTSYVYRETELLNDSEEDLLAGPITVYLDGRFVGRSEIPTVARGQGFVVGLGADSQLRCRRELAERKEDVQGGNRELQFEYRLVVENYKNQPAKLRVVDRLPYNDARTDLRVTLLDNPPLSDDKLYLRNERPKGILRWEIEVPAGASGHEAHLLTYSYKVEFDRKFTLTTTRNQPEQQQEFEQLQRSRSKL